MTGSPRVTVIAGGVGAARFLAGLLPVIGARNVTAIVNVADDTILHGLHVGPDLDTVTYTLSGQVNPDTGWGLAGESWQAMTTMERLGGPAWFRLGDRDLGTHLYRTHRLREGATLTTVTAEIARGFDLELTLCPVTDDPVQTFVTLAPVGDGVTLAPVGDGVTLAPVGEEVAFQDYFVRRRHADPITAVTFRGLDVSRPAPGVIAAIEEADVVVIAPSNPIVSIGPVVGVPGVREALRAHRSAVVAVSPIIAGAALKGPADRMLTELGHEASVRGVARLYADMASVLVVDEADRSAVADIEAEGMGAMVCPTIMSAPAIAEALARATLAAVGVHLDGGRP